MINEKLTLPCGAEIKNRFLKSAMTEGLAKSDATANKRHIISMKDGLKAE